ncbi:hypothetical protein [Actinoplanes sp. NPDC049118]|uniref:hypothetical protein n=1 Tax=Actinoplanes sp. NPDC049118 TaxID=3155769 RepID=UPI0033CF57BA
MPADDVEGMRPPQMKITAAQADELLARAWFEGYTSEVELHEEPVTVAEFDVEARSEEKGDTDLRLIPDADLHAGGRSISDRPPAGHDAYVW